MTLPLTVTKVWNIRRTWELSSYVTMSKRTEELKIRISPEDKERIKMKMADTGILNMSAYVRKMALDGICVRLDLEDVRQLTVMLRRCTNNLNQYARRANESGSIYAADIEDLLQTIPRPACRYLIARTSSGTAASSFCKGA